MFFLIIFISFLLFELFIFFSLKKFKKNFQWLITEEDEFPVFDKIKFQKFKINSLDEKLGWRQKLEGSGFKIKKKKYSNSINNHRILLNKKSIYFSRLMFIVITQMTDLLGKNKFPKKIIIIF